MSNSTLTLNQKISAMPTITIVDDNTYIPVVKGNPTFKNYKIKPDDLLADVKQRISDLETILSGYTNDILTGITQDVNYIEEDLTSLASNRSNYPYVADYASGNTWQFNCGFYNQIQLANIPTDPEQVYAKFYLTGGHFRPDFFLEYFTGMTQGNVYALEEYSIYKYTINWIEPGQSYTDYDRSKWNPLVIYAIDTENKTIDVKWWPKFDLV